MVRIIKEVNTVQFELGWLAGVFACSALLPNLYPKILWYTAVLKHVLRAA